MGRGSVTLMCFVPLISKSYSRNSSAAFSFMKGTDNNPNFYPSSESWDISFSANCLLDRHHASVMSVHQNLQDNQFLVIHKSFNSVAATKNISYNT